MVANLLAAINDSSVFPAMYRKILEFSRKSFVFNENERVWGRKNERVFEEEKRKERGRSRAEQREGEDVLF